MVYIEISICIYDCICCPTRCDGKSKAVCDFEKDVALFEAIENEIINKINHSCPNSQLSFQYK